MEVRRFVYDRFETVDVSKLGAGDQVLVHGQMVRVTAPAVIRGNDVHLPAERPEQAVILCDFSDNALTRAMDQTGSAVHVFEDGTSLIAELDGSSDQVYSPRLPKAELIAFCEKHQARYAAFYEQNAAAIDDGSKVPMEPWW